jgi:hypothetical protein
VGKYVVLCSVSLFACGGGGSSGSVTVKAPRAADSVIAFRDGDGAWATKPGAQAPFSFSVSSGTYTVAIACPGKTSVTAYRATPDELSTIEYQDECRPTPATLTFHFVGADASTARAQWGVALVGGTLAPNGDSIIPVPLDTADFLATRNPPLFVDRLVIQRGLAVTANTTVNVDYDASTAIVPETRSVSTFGSVYTYFVTAGGTAINLSLADDLAMVVPEAILGPGDLHVFSTESDRGVGAPSFAGALHAARTAPSSVTTVMYVDESPVVSSTAAGSYVLPKATWSPQPDAVMYELAVANPQRRWVTMVSSEVFATTGSLETPDLSTVPGWDPTTGLVSGTFAWQVRYLTGMEPEQLLRTYPSVEGTVQYAGWTGQSQ